ncbi:hypothetical protein JCM17960_00240 [Magnetospira thiophila]
MNLARRIVMLFLIGAAFSVIAANAEAAKRVALVVGNDSYATLPNLNNARRDARDVAAKLKALGFQVILHLDAGERQMGRAMADFENKLAGGDAGLVFYAGHGVQADGHNWLIPSDARVEDETDLPYEAIDAADFLTRMQRAGAPVNIVILDACRDNPLPKRKRSAARGLSVTAVPAVQGIAMLFSAGPGEAAQDGARGGNGVFTGALLKSLDQPGLTVEQVFKETARQVNRATLGQQTPWINASLTGDFYFAPGAANKSAATKSGNNAESELWRLAEELQARSGYEAYLKDYPSGQFSTHARLRLQALEPQQVASLPPEPQPAPRPSYRVQAMDETLFVVKTANVRSEPSATSDKLGLLDAGRPVGVTGRTEVSGATWYRVALTNGEAGYVYGSLLDEREPLPIAPIRPAAPVRTGNLSPGDIFRDCENAYVATAGRYAPSGAFCGPEMVVIPSGSFQMGSNDGYDNEKPVHRVNIGYQFAVGKYEVTQAEWQAVMGSNPSKFKGSNRPVEQVSWNDAQTFIEKLNRKTGQRYRLLSESEWEYVARAGTTTTYSWGNSAGSGNANCDGCGSRWDNKETAPVGSFRANPFGVHDMHGNVLEWVQDCYQDSYANTPTDGSARGGNNSCDRVYRGGSWISIPRDLRSANRYGLQPDYRSLSLGFRLARTL